MALPSSRRFTAVSAALVVVGVLLVAVAPALAPEPPDDPIEAEDCESIEVVVFEADDDRPVRYEDLSERQRAIFEEALSNAGEVVEFEGDRREPAYGLPPYVEHEGTVYRVSTSGSDCWERPPPYGRIATIGGYVLVGLGAVGAAVGAWRRVTY